MNSSITTVPNDTSAINICDRSSAVLEDLVAEALLNQTAVEPSTDDDVTAAVSVVRHGFADKPRRRSSILKSGKPRVKKSVSFCSMPEDRRISNGMQTYQSVSAISLLLSCRTRLEEVLLHMPAYHHTQ